MNNNQRLWFLLLVSALCAALLIFNFNTFESRLNRSLSANGVTMHALDAAIKNSDDTKLIITTLWSWVVDPKKKPDQRTLAANSLHLLIIDEWKLPKAASNPRTSLIYVLEGILRDEEVNGTNLDAVMFFRSLIDDYDN